MQRKLIDFKGSTTVIGLTQSGKTYAVKKSLLAVEEGVIFFNYKLDDMPKSYVKADRKNDIRQLKEALRQGKKINYIPHSQDFGFTQVELEYLIKNLHVLQKLNIYFVVDEVHLIKRKETLNEMIRLATTGLSFGLKSVWISQRPALIDNTLMTQSEKFVIFKTNMEKSYMERHGFPIHEIEKRIITGGQYAYCEYDWHEVKGAFKVG